MAVIRNGFQEIFSAWQDVRTMFRTLSVLFGGAEDGQDPPQDGGA